MDEGRLVDSGHGSGRPQSAKHRPADVPESFVFDRHDKIWREPRKPGPRAADDVEDQGAELGDGGGWRAERDQAGAHLSGGRADEPRPEAGPEIRQDVESLLALLALPVGAVAERRDPYCGAVFADQLPAIVHAAAPIVCRSERVVRWLTADTGGLMDWVGLAMALAPVGRAVAEHHVLRIVDPYAPSDGTEPTLAEAAA